MIIIAVRSSSGRAHGFPFAIPFLDNPDPFGMPCAVFADKLRITSTPPGAAREIDGVNMGTTPFEIELQSISGTFTGAVSASVSGTSASLRPALPWEEVVRQAKPAVVYLKGLDKAGSGFFVTGTGIIVTIAHVARGEESLLAMLSTGQQIEAKVVYIDAVGHG